MRLDAHRLAPPVVGRHHLEREPHLAAQFGQSRPSLPSRPLPSAKSGPTHSSRSGRCCVSMPARNSAAGVAAVSRVNGRTITKSRPSAASRSARSSFDRQPRRLRLGPQHGHRVRLEGEQARPAPPAACAAADSSATSIWWPRCTPSKLPMVRKTGPSRRRDGESRRRRPSVPRSPRTPCRATTRPARLEAQDGDDRCHRRRARSRRALARRVTLDRLAVAQALGLFFGHGHGRQLRERRRNRVQVVAPDRRRGRRRPSAPG